MKCCPGAAPPKEYETMTYRQIGSVSGFDAPSQQLSTFLRSTPNRGHSTQVSGRQLTSQALIVEVKLPSKSDVVTV